LRYAGQFAGQRGEFFDHFLGGFDQLGALANQR
jgi:hypothetical protein